MLAADIAFHRYFQRPDKLARYHYLGKQPLEELDEGLANHMKSVQDHVNAGYERTSEQLLANGQHPLVYCDYIKPGSQNEQTIAAHAFYDEGRYFIGLTTPLIMRLSECSGYLAESPYVRRLFKMPFGDDIYKDGVRGEILYTLFFGHQLNFVFGHELGHHFHGHTRDEDDCSWKDFSFDTAFKDKTSFITEHAHEIQADNYAAEYMLTGLFEDPIRTNSLSFLGRQSSDSEARELLIGIYVVTVGSLLFALPNPSFVEERLRMGHPLKAARLNNMVSRISTFLRQRAPDLVEWLSLNKFNIFLETIRSSIPPIPDSLTAETSYMLSAAGTEYYKLLIQEVQRLQEAPNPYRWQAANAT